jgi:hypothetical protein
MIIQGTPPTDITGNLKQALSTANWITNSDQATIALAQRLALSLDVAFDSGDVATVSQLSQRYLQVLQQLQLTPETRTQGKREDETDGSNHRADYLRLLNTKAGKPKIETTQRGSGSRKPS